MSYRRRRLGDSETFATKIRCPQLSGRDCACECHTFGMRRRRHTFGERAAPRPRHDSPPNALAAGAPFRDTSFPRQS
eukprot:scaffold107329_cov30-Tisochrysis_lutea.AAC.7